MRKFFPALCLCLIPSIGFGQGAYYSNFVINSSGKPVGGATITVCTASATLIPTIVTLAPGCTPTVAIYSDPGLTDPITNSILQADGLGNFAFYINPGTYTYAVIRPSVTAHLYPIMLPVVASSTTSLKGLNGILLVDQFPGADMGAKIIACNTAVVAAGGGTCDARGFQGAQTAPTGFTVGGTSLGSPAVKLLLGAVTITTGAPVQVGTGSSIVGQTGMLFPGLPNTGTSVIYGKHTGIAVVSLAGSIYATLRDVYIGGDPSTTPQTGILCGRTSVASAGLHTVENVTIYGSFSKAVIYSIASESNTWNEVTAWLTGGSAKYVFYTSQSDDLSIGGLTASTNTTGWVKNSGFLNFVGGSGSSTIYINAGNATNDWDFEDTYLTLGAAGSSGTGSNYVDLNVTANSYGTVTFRDVGGETAGLTYPDNAYYIHSPSSFVLTGLQVIGGLVPVAANDFIYVQSGTVTLDRANISPGWVSGLPPSQMSNLTNSNINMAGSSLAVLGSATGNIIQAQSLTVGGVSQSLVLITNSGNGGMGTASPQATWDVAGQDRRKPVTFSTLTACSSTIEGETAAVTDSTTNTWGATITGSGANHVLAYCDGANWTVAAK